MSLEHARTLHVVALPHTTLTERDSSCAYSMKVLKFVPMMQALGCRVILYGPDLIDCKPDEHVVITTEADRKRWGFEPGFDTVVGPLEWDARKPYWFESATRASDAMRERYSRGDYLCLITSTQGAIADAICGPSWNQGMLTVEWGVGYIGVDWRSHAAFESYAWMHHVYGLRDIGDGRAFDRVIPNFFDASQFYTTKPKGDYLLYMGRVILRKGPHIAAEIAKAAGMKLVVAGYGVTEHSREKIVGGDGVELHGDVEYVGPVGFEGRAELMANAAAVMVPTVYIEPFGGVAVEAMLSGAPVITSDWGSFTEIVTPDVGRRFRTLREGVRAVEEVRDLDRKKIRKAARARYSQEAVGPMFMKWFDSLDTLWHKGWYEV